MWCSLVDWLTVFDIVSVRVRIYCYPFSLLAIQKLVENQIQSKGAYMRLTSVHESYTYHMMCTVNSDLAQSDE